MHQWQKFGENPSTDTGDVAETYSLENRFLWHRSAVSHGALLEILQRRIVSRIGFCGTDLPSVTELYNDADDALFETIMSNSAHTLQPKFCDDISNGSWVIGLTDRQTDKQTDTAENNTTLLHYAALW